MPALLTPLVTKLADSDSSPLVVQLLVVVAQLTLIDAKQLIDCLASQPAPGTTRLSLLLQLHLAALYSLHQGAYSCLCCCTL